MNQKEITILFAYIYNNMTRLDDEVRDRQSVLRYRDVTVNDCIELACAIERRDMFRQTTTDIRHLLELYSDKGGE